MTYDDLIDAMIKRWIDLTIRQILISHALEIMVRDALKSS